eukprot:superscaffoldBa00000912_g7956
METERCWEILSGPELSCLSLQLALVTMEISCKPQKCLVTLIVATSMHNWIYQEPKNDGECLNNIKEFLKGCTSFRVEPFEASDLLLGLNFSKVLSSLVALNKVTADIGVGSDSVCARHSSAHRIKSFESLSSQASLGRSSKLLQNQFRSLDMSENSGQQLLVKARFNFQQTNEDELTFNKGDIISVTRQEDGGWWEGMLNGKAGWFPSNYVREIKGSDKQVSPKSGTLKSPPKGFDTSAISKTYYNLVLQNILETETEYSKDLQSLMTNYLRPLQSIDKLSSSDVSLILGNLEEISTFQQMLEKSERYLMLFPHVLLMLSASPRMSGFIFQGKLPLASMTVTKLEDCEAHKNAFELSGPMFDRLLVACTNQQDLQDWVEHLTRQIKHTAATAPSHKPLTVPCHTLPSHPLTPSRHAEGRAMTVAPTYHTLPHPSSHGTSHSTMMWGPLEPPNTPKPWSLSCLRPAPPLRPSAALCYKEDLSKSPKSVKKLLPKRKPERKQSEEEFALRKSTAALEEDAQILKVIEAYCTSAKTRQTLNSTWQGTDLMHNHVLADVDRSCVDSPGRRSSMSRPELTSDLSEDSDYDSIWTTHTYRMGSVPRPRRETGLHVIIPGEERVLDPSRNGQSTAEE